MNAELSCLSSQRLTKLVNVELAYVSWSLFSFRKSVEAGSSRIELAEVDVRVVAEPGKWAVNESW
jgi:hypothetical protein